MCPDIIAEIDAFMQDLLHCEEGHAPLYRMMGYHIGHLDGDWKPLPESQSALYGGKKLRAQLTSLACMAAGGSCEASYPVAAAIELIQNFSLVHDDIEDGDRERRHRPTVWVMWGVPHAINVGSSMQALVNRAVLKTKAPADTVLDILRSVTDAMVEMTEGQYLDISFQKVSAVSVSAYEDMASRKTGALMEAAAFSGARLATSDQHKLGAWRRFGRAFGQAFQAQDDLLGVVGNPKLTGKPVGNDIRARKKALPLVYALSLAEAKDVVSIREVMEQAEVDDAGVETVTGVMKRSGALDSTAADVERFTTSALLALEESGASGEGLTNLRKMVLRSVSRER